MTIIDTPQITTTMHPRFQTHCNSVEIQLNGMSYAGKQLLCNQLRAHYGNMIHDAFPQTFGIRLTAAKDLTEAFVRDVVAKMVRDHDIR